MVCSFFCHKNSGDVWRDLGFLMLFFVKVYSGNVELKRNAGDFCIYIFFSVSWVNPLSCVREMDIYCIVMHRFVFIFFSKFIFQTDYIFCCFD